MNTPTFHRLLDKQITKHLTDDCLKHKSFQDFIKVVNDSYINFERDKELFELTSELNARENAEINERLTKEVRQRKISVDKLIEAIYSLEETEGLDASKIIDTNNLLVLVDYLKVQIDIQRKNEIELRLAKELAECATKAKSDFLSMMSHEIRTPLNAIMGLTHFMQQEDISANMAENLKILQFSADNLHVLINDILDFNKIEAGNVELQKVPFDLKQLIYNVKNANQAKADENKNLINLVIADNVPNLVIGDSLRLGQVISNLVSNAVKFTKDGSIKIELSVQKFIDNKAVLDFSVTDTGIGIAPQKQELIFDKFTQANSETTREFGGTGLGLVITKKLLQLYGSEIKLESVLGEGAKFYFSIVLESVLEVVNPKKDIDIKFLQENLLQGVKVLLVEDYPINIKLATKFLERWKINIDIAENGKIAVEKFRINKYDLILMDIQMPVMDGYMATAEIRKIDTKIPIIAFTASETLNNQDHAFSVGMNDYLNKPFNPKDLYNKIAKYSINV